MKTLFRLLLVSLFCSCASTPRFEVQVSALAGAGSDSARAFLIEPAQQGESPLQWQEYRGFVERALTEEGWRPATTPEQADLIVRVAYGIGDPEEVEVVVQQPVFGQIGQTTSTQTVYDPLTGFGQQQVTTPEFGVQYYQSSTQTTILYRRFLTLSAYGRSASGDGTSRVLWEVRTRSTGSSGDIRRVFPILLAAARPHLGQSTKREITVVLKEDQKAVQEITGD